MPSSETIQIVQLIATVAMGVALYVLNRKTDEIRSVKNALEKSEQVVREATRQLIEERLTAVRLELTGSQQLAVQQIGDLAKRMHEVAERLDKGETRFRLTDERSHKLEVEVLKAINDLKDKVATKDDLNHMREELRRG